MLPEILMESFTAASLSCAWQGHDPLDSLSHCQQKVSTRSHLSQNHDSVSTSKRKKCERLTQASLLRVVVRPQQAETFRILLLSHVHPGLPGPLRDRPQQRVLMCGMVENTSKPSPQEGEAGEYLQVPG